MRGRFCRVLMDHGLRGNFVMGAFVCIHAQQCGSTSLLPRAWTTSFGHPSHVQSTSGMKSRTSSSSGLGRSLDESANRGREGQIHERDGVSCGSRGAVVQAFHTASASCRAHSVPLCNSMMKYSQEDPTVWLIFKSVLAWSSRAGAPVQMCIAAVSEAPHGNASAYPDKFDARGAFRSQGGKVVFLTTEDLCEKQGRSCAHHRMRWVLCRNELTMVQAKLSRSS